MSPHSYAAFLPAARQVQALEAPTSQYWQWRGHRIHIARRENPSAPVRLVVCHGAGGYSDALWPLCAQIRHGDCDLSLPDLPLYGHSATAFPRKVRYEDWVECLCDFLEESDDGRPVILWGFSIGGMLAHEVACRSPRVHEVIASCLVDPQLTQSRRHIARWGLGVVAAPFLGVGRRRPLADVMIPMRLVANMTRMSHNPELSALCMQDPRGGGARVPLGFLASFLTYQHTFAGDDPASQNMRITLVHPAADQWTPPSLSMHSLARMGGVRKAVMLDHCGHFPIEEPGLSQMINVVETILEANANATV